MGYATLVRTLLSCFVALGFIAEGCGFSGGDPDMKPPPAAPPAPPKTEAPPPAAPAPAAPPDAGLKPPPPLAADRSEAGVAHGAELYGRICSVCHGAHGEGYKADQAPALGNQAYLATVSDEFLRVAIENGRAGTVMSAWSVQFGGPLQAADVAAVLGFLRSWQKQPAIELDEKPMRGAAFSGASIFSRECAKCHGPKGPNLRLMNPQLLEHASPGFLRHAIRNGRPPTSMPAYAQSLGERGVEDVVAYLTTLAKSPALQQAGVVELPKPFARNAVPLNPRGREPRDFTALPEFTSVDVVARELKAGAKMTLLDARAPSDYAREHIKGAVNIPFYDPSPFFDKLPKKGWLVCYCGCPHAESGALAQKLSEAGFTQVTVLNEGLGDWMTKGHPMRSGALP
ncbi:MAG TPA: c-type cytochrome [Polyangiales bacterium]|nr:c-type cytochrome [Polyangiales bacterium]